MKYVKCEHCKTPLKNWDGIVVYDKQKETQNVFCTPCLMVINKEYDGSKRFERIAHLAECFYNTEKAEEKILKLAQNNETKEKAKEWFKIVTEQKSELNLGTEAGPSDFWNYIGYSCEDDYYFDHFDESKKEYFESKALEYLSYQKFFELIIFLAKQTDGRDHRYYLIASEYEKNHLIMKWFEEMKISKRKEGYLPLIEFIRNSIDNIWRGILSVEDSLYLIRIKYIEYLDIYENIKLELKAFEEKDKKNRIDRINKKWDRD